MTSLKNREIADVPAELIDGDVGVTWISTSSSTTTQNRVRRMEILLGGLVRSVRGVRLQADLITATPTSSSTTATLSHASPSRRRSHYRGPRGRAAGPARRHRSEAH